MRTEAPPQRGSLAADTRAALPRGTSGSRVAAVCATPGKLAERSTRFHRTPDGVLTRQPADLQWKTGALSREKAGRSFAPPSDHLECPVQPIHAPPRGRSLTPPRALAQLPPAPCVRFCSAELTVRQFLTHGLPPSRLVRLFCVQPVGRTQMGCRRHSGKGTSGQLPREATATSAGARAAVRVAAASAPPSGSADWTGRADSAPPTHIPRGFVQPFAMTPAQLRDS